MKRWPKVQFHSKKTMMVDILGYEMNSIKMKRSKDASLNIETTWLIFKF